MGVPPSAGSSSVRTYHRARAPRGPLAALAALAVVGGWLFVRWRPFRVEVRGDSMRPALEAGDWALALGAARLRRGSVVVVEHPKRPGFEMVKRVVAVPRDVAPDGRVLDRDEVWVEGDAHDASTDSRHFGPARREHVRGIVRLVYRPPGRRRLV